jgi:cobalamin biosynthesis Mg chelatase CobN
VLCVLATLATPAGADALAPSTASPDAKAAGGTATATSKPAENNAAPAAGGTAAPDTRGAAATTTPATGAGAPTTTTGAVPTTTTPQPSTRTSATSPAASTPAGADARARSRSHRSGKLSTPAIALAALAGLLALACLAWALARLLAYEPHWVKSLRHALAEGGFRASATWAEFVDWARLGR